MYCPCAGVRASLRASRSCSSVCNSSRAADPAPPLWFRSLLLSTSSVSGGGVSASCPKNLTRISSLLRSQFSPPRSLQSRAQVCGSSPRDVSPPTPTVMDRCLLDARHADGWTVLLPWQVERLHDHWRAALRPSCCAHEEAGAWHGGGRVGDWWVSRSKKIPHAGGARFFGGSKQVKILLVNIIEDRKIDL